MQILTFCPSAQESTLAESKLSCCRKRRSLASAASWLTSGARLLCFFRSYSWKICFWISTCWSKAVCDEVVPVVVVAVVGMLLLLLLERVCDDGALP
jgi:hypothetical protein